MESIKNYQLLEKIAEGGFGEVYKGKRKDIDSVFFSLKIFKNTLDPLRLKKEMETLFSLNHPGIVRVFDANLEEPPYYLVMEYCQGKTLRALLLEKEKLHLKEACLYASQLLSCLDYLHSHKVIHGDIKPENIMIDPEGKLKMIDFGLSDWYDPEVLKMSLSFSVEGSQGGGSLYYMAPEIVEKAQPLPQSDVFSTGVVLYEMMKGFAYPLFEEIEPLWYEKLVQKAIQREAEKRFSDGQKLYQEFLIHSPSSLLAGSHLPHSPSSSWENFLEQMREARKTKDWGKIEKIADHILSSDPSQEEALFHLKKANLYQKSSWMEGGHFSVGAGKKITAMAISPDEQSLAVAIQGKKEKELQSNVLLFSLPDRQLRHTFSGRGFYISHLQFLFQGRELAGWGENFLLWDVVEKKKTSRFFSGKELSFFSYLPLQKWIVVGEKGGGISFWDEEKERELFSLSSEVEMASVSVSSSKNLVALMGKKNQAEIWELTPSLSWEKRCTLATLGNQGLFHRWDPKLMVPPQVWKENAWENPGTLMDPKRWQNFSKPLFSPSGDHLAAVENSGLVYVFDTFSLESFPMGHSLQGLGEIETILFSPQEDSLVLGLNNGFMAFYHWGKKEK